MKENILQCILIKKFFLKAYVWNVALYGCKMQAISKEEKLIIEAFETWCDRRLLGLARQTGSPMKKQNVHDYVVL